MSLLNKLYTFRILKESIYKSKFQVLQKLMQLSIQFYITILLESKKSERIMIWQHRHIMILKFTQNKYLFPMTLKYFIW